MLAAVLARWLGRLRKPRYLLGSLAVLAVALVITIAPAREGAAAPLGQNEPPRTGGAYWAGRYGCIACHGLRGEGTPIGPAIAGIPDVPVDYARVLRQVRTPILLMPDFPPDVLSDDKVQAIVEYYATFDTAR